MIETSISPGEWYVTFLKDGKQFMVVHKVVSADGKNMSLHYTGADEQGNPLEQVDVYERNQ